MGGAWMMLLVGGFEEADVVFPLFEIAINGFMHGINLQREFCLVVDVQP